MINALLPIAIAATDNKIKTHREENDTVYNYGCNDVKIVTFHNKGAFLGLGEKNPAIVMALSAALTLIISIVYVLTLGKKGAGALKLGLGLLLGGACSNTYDRIKKGYVVDYLIFPKAPGRVKNVIFNLSDFAIIIGAFISALSDK